MANIVFRLPSKQITYGYVEVSGTPEEFGIHSVADADAIGITYAHYVNRYLEGEQEGIRQVTGEAERAPKKAPGKPVGGVSGVRQVRPEEFSPEVAAKRLEEGKKPRTVDEANDMVTALIQKELGATVIDEGTLALAAASGYHDVEAAANAVADGEAPWYKPTEASKPKPWENKATPKVASIDW